jgi:hypothetical protein
LKPELELLWELRATVTDPVILGETPKGLRRVVRITQGTFEGPGGRGELVGGGTDWQVLRSDGVLLMEAKYLLRTDDGVLIEVDNRGYRHGPAQVLERVMAGENVSPTEYYFRATPLLTAPPGRYDWLNRSMFICTAARLASEVQLWFYTVR